MSETLKVTVNIERNGQAIPGFPLVKRLTVDEIQQAAPYEKADDGDGTTFSTLPTTQMAELNFLFITADQKLTFRLDGQSDAGIVLNATGFILLCNTDIDAGASTNAKVNNNTGSTATVTLIGGGT